MLRVIKEAKPRWVVGENVAGFVNMALDGCISDLEGAGYEVAAFIIPACGVGADHKRERVWIVANSCCIGLEKTRCYPKNSKKIHSEWQRCSASIENDFDYRCNRETEPPFLREDDGVSGWMDRIKGLGNAIVPQVVAPIFECIKTIENHGI